ncbi:MAG TPA: aminomethyl-transferring glycine dehydrogenase [Gemmatimonadaceae bacterium]|jgi:glycine dehydrogenase|nr:aminomethyl-transferring glycine dehydrogenase [Gemmatimonadaceae bacterium]
MQIPFAARHIGPSDDEIGAMASVVGYSSLDALIDAAVPPALRTARPLDLAPALGEHEALVEMRRLADDNNVYRSFIGMGYTPCLVPPVLQRNILENPAWYTAYTPYQAEIAQGRLEALITFQTMIADLTGLPVANASLLDEPTAAAEAMALALAACGDEGRDTFFVSQHCHPQTIAVVGTRARARGIRLDVGDAPTDMSRLFGALVQYPTTDGAVRDYRSFAEQVHAAGALLIAAADPLALTLLTPPGEWGADVAVGSTQRFGVPMGAGGPHAAYFATRDAYKRLVPGRIIGVSRDADGEPAFRMALQMREQHIRREKATSNVCTAQVLLAVMSAMYAAWHGPDGLARIARHVHRLTTTLADGLRQLGFSPVHDVFFDTLRLDVGRARAAAILERAYDRGMNLRLIGDASIGITLAEPHGAADVDDLLAVCAGHPPTTVPTHVDAGYDAPLRRTSPYLTHSVFQTHRSETAMLRYLNRLASRDLSLTSAMIPLGSCTMKLNATAELMPITWPALADVHPYAPEDQLNGYATLTDRLGRALAEITGFDAVSLQPNAGSQGELAGLLAIRRWQSARGEGHRDVCLIPQSAHGTNAASAVMAGLRVIPVRTDPCGNIDLGDLATHIATHRSSVAALMVTYPSTHGVFEPGVRDACALVHSAGGKVYLDGANLNAMVGLVRPAEIGADVCHVNLHKTFCIPHGGGGPGMGPIAVTRELAPFLPADPLAASTGEHVGAISAAQWGSAGILPISDMYIRMMGGDGLTLATKVAILNANYIANRLADAYPLLYTGPSGLVAHECIIDPRAYKTTAGIDVEDIAKRLMDYGFHAPTVSFPVPGTLMIEPTESESRAELDRFCDAMLAIREEIREIELGLADRQDNVLKRAPHTARQVTADVWDRPYPRERAAFPAPWTRDYKFWPAVARIDAAYGDRNLFCTCPAVA